MKLQVLCQILRVDCDYRDSLGVAPTIYKLYLQEVQNGKYKIVTTKCILKILEKVCVPNYYFSFKCNIDVIIMRNYHCNYDA